jgi:prevent-host-death family protein
VSAPERIERLQRVWCITRNTLAGVADVSIRELRNQGGDIVDRAAQGEEITITRSGTPVAELRAVRPALSAESLLDGWKRLPAVDPATLLADVDRELDPTL